MKMLLGVALALLLAYPALAQRADSFVGEYHATGGEDEYTYTAKTYVQKKGDVYQLYWQYDNGTEAIGTAVLFMHGKVGTLSVAFTTESGLPGVGSVIIVDGQIAGYNWTIFGKTKTQYERWTRPMSPPL